MSGPSGGPRSTGTDRPDADEPRSTPPRPVDDAAPSAPRPPAATAVTVDAEAPTPPSSRWRTCSTLVETLTAERDASSRPAPRSRPSSRTTASGWPSRSRSRSARAAEALVTKLLPALDAFEGALTHAAEASSPLWNSLWPTLEREGLSKLAPTGEAFDPNLTRRWRTSPATAAADVAEVFRSGYAWKGRVLRPAMVKVRD